MRFKTIFAAVVAAIALSGCKTDVDLNAPYQEFTTIYGLLDLSADTQVVRVNKSFLGSGSAYDFAAIKDSSEYHPDEVEVFIEFGNHSVQLEPHLLNREPGSFYDQDVLVYITTENLALDNSGIPISNVNEYNTLPTEYKLIVKVKGKTITGVTHPVYLRNVGNLDKPNPNVPLNWGGITVDGEDNFITSYVEKATMPNGHLYEASVVFNYTDYYTGNSEGHAKTVVYKLGRQSAQTGSVQFQYSPEALFNQVINELNCTNVAYRTVQPAEFRMTVAGEDLARYISINNPVTGIVTERPEYSNVEGENAIGLFSSRFTSSILKAIESTTRELIMDGALMGQFCFCDPNSISYTCPEIDSTCNCGG